jgi:hypothetical protein
MAKPAEEAEEVFWGIDFHDFSQVTKFFYLFSYKLFIEMDGTPFTTFLLHL